MVGFESLKMKSRHRRSVEKSRSSVAQSRRKETVSPHTIPVAGTTAQNEGIVIKNLKKFNRESGLVLNCINSKAVFLSGNSCTFFASDSTQGVVGKVTVEGCSHPDEAKVTGGSEIVFKVSHEVDNVIEHESTILQGLTTFKEFFPHFVGYYGTGVFQAVEREVKKRKGRDSKRELIKLISSTDPGIVKEFNGCTIIPKSVLFLEYLSDQLEFESLLSTRRVSKFFNPPREGVNDREIYRLRRQLIPSILLQLLFALHVAQTDQQFTSYDFHTGNVLIRRCEADSLFLYVCRNKSYLVPTYGYYPVVIDMGFAHSSSVTGKPLLSQTVHYHRGFQSAVYDGLRDAYHITVSVFRYLSEKHPKTAFSGVYTIIQDAFHGLPILDETGWIKLPCNLERRIINKLRTEAASLFTGNSFFSSQKYHILGLLNELVVLPFRKKSENSNLGESVTTFVTEFVKIIPITKKRGNRSGVFPLKGGYPQYSLHVLKSVISLVIKHRGGYLENVNGTKEVKKRVVDVWFTELLAVKHPHLPFSLNFSEVDRVKLFVSALLIGERLSANYCMLTEKNSSVTNSCYSQLGRIQSAIDVYGVIASNLTPYFNLSKGSLIYTINIDKKNISSTHLFHLTYSQLEQVNSAAFLNKGTVLSGFISL